LKEILIKTSQGEMSLQFLCDKEYRRICAILNMIETEFNTSMSQHLELRKYLLDTGNFIQKIPEMISEIIEVKGDKNEYKK